MKLFMNDKNLRVALICAGIVALIVVVFLLFGCATMAQPLEKQESFIVPELEFTLCGPDDVFLRSKRADGLWWTDGMSNHVYVRGWRFREKFIADSY